MDLALLKQLGERALSAAIVVLVGALGGDASGLFSLDWGQVGAAALGAAVLAFLQGWLASTGVVGDKGSPALVKEPRAAALSSCPGPGADGTCSGGCEDCPSR